MTKSRFRSIWISDVHLGVKNCKADFLLDFLRYADCDQLYLIGDIVDFWYMPRGRRWPDSHNQVLQALLEKSNRGTRVIYIPGNHDELARQYTGLFFGGIEIVPHWIHETADGRRLLVSHGDEFDNAVKCGRLLEWVGDRGYNLLLFANHLINFMRRRLNYPYWSLANFLKQRIGRVADYIARFEQAAAHEAARRNLDGIICGHIHKPELREIGGIMYCNDGDWVESCTALVEHVDGRMEIIHWTDRTVVMLQERRIRSAAA
jgi:UDP-2,3-diacylglucosamine pyrophosphatase LpxH